MHLAERTRREDGCGEEVTLALQMKVSHGSKSMAFAQRLILLRVERLPLQVDLAESAHKASIMPAVAQGL